MRLKRQVVMLPTNEKANDCPILYFPKPGRLNIRVYSDEELRAGKGLVKLDYTANHLYILSDEKIEVGDWTICEGKVTKSSKSYAANNDYGKKIIASTDKSLRVIAGFQVMTSIIDYEPMPEVSNAFVQKYVTEYNKGNVITEVMVEYKTVEEDDWNSRAAIAGFSGKAWKEIKALCVPALKVDKDNCISIYKVKDTWSREEVEEIYRRGRNQAYTETKGGFDLFDIVEASDKWIKENL